MESIIRLGKKNFSAFKSKVLPIKYHFRFITVHYIIIIGVSFIGSVCLYVSGNLDYIDAFFLASGATTQAGLNTVDLNLLNTWQQIVLYIIPIISNPVTMNTSVVFLRLWWFEKKFQHVVREARKHRRSISKTFTRAKNTDRNLDIERGIKGRKITVMHGAPAHTRLDSTPILVTSEQNQEKIDEIQKQMQSWNNFGSDKNNFEPPSLSMINETVQRQIKFADQVNVEGDIAGINRLPMPRSQEDHIAVLQRQRDGGDGEVLRIPGPRDAEAGIPPHSIRNAFDPTYSHGNRRSFADKETDFYPEYSSPKNNSTFPSISLDIPKLSSAAEYSTARKNSLLNSRIRKSSVLIADNFQNQRKKSFQTIKSVLSRDKEDLTPYLSWQPTIGRNSAFLDLTEQQREELGGIEYRTLKTLGLILLMYIFGFTFLGVISLVPWILKESSFGEIVEANGQGRVWWGFFTANSAFTDLGFTLTPDSMISFKRATWPLIIMSFLIISGNTAFPIMLRIFIWIGARFTPAGSGVHQELGFLLDHPRRCFTLLFPAGATLWLALILILLNTLDVIFFIILDLSKNVVSSLPMRIRVLDGLFQAVSTRTAGFSIVDLSLIHPAVQVSFLIMMYISVFPIAISVRRTNVYEERSLGIYSLPNDEEEEEAHQSYITTHLRHQLSFDLWYICLGLFIISISEGDRLQNDDSRFNLFAVIFEIISAYGTVGLSLGYKDINASFSSQFGVIGKLVIIAMQIRGRHRGLPNELDRAIILPSEKLQQKEEEDSALIAQLRRPSNATDIASGLRKTASKGQGSGLLNTFLNPGPPLPRSYRNLRGSQNL